MGLDLNNINKPQVSEDNKLKLLVLPSFNLRAFSFTKEQISNSSKLITTVILPLITKKDISLVKEQTENIFFKAFKKIKEFSYKTVQLFGLESWVEKAAELVKNVFKSIVNVFTGKSLLEEDKKPETSFAQTLGNLALASAAKNALREEQKNDNGPYSGLLGLGSLKKIEEGKRKEEQVLVSKLIKYGEKVIDRAERAYLKLALALNHFRNPELAKVEKLIAEVEKS